MILRTAPVFSSAARPVVAVAGVVVDHGQVGGAVPAQRVDQLDRLPGRAEAADQDGGAVVDVGDGLVGRVVALEHVDAHQLDVLQHDGQALPTPMQIAATPQRCPPSRITLASVPRTRPPEAPSGCPIAMAPPRVFTIAGSSAGLLGPRVQADQRLHREGLVELDGADVGPVDAGAAHRLLGGLDGCVAEVLRVQRVAPRARDPRDGGAAQPRRRPAPSRAARPRRRR